MKRTYAEAVEISIKWWSEKAFDTLSNHDNGDKSADGFLGRLLMNVWGNEAVARVTPQMRADFELKLRSVLMGKEGLGLSHNRLSVDYDPNENLYLACKFSGVNPACLPVKTFTQIEANGAVRGRYQYGGDWFEL